MILNLAKEKCAIKIQTRLRILRDRKHLKLKEEFDARRAERTAGAQLMRSSKNYNYLLRPDSRFSYTWRLIAVASIFFEVIQVLVSQKLSNGNFKKLSFPDLVKAVLLRPGELVAPITPRKIGIKDRVFRCSQLLNIDSQTDPTSQLFRIFRSLRFKVCGLKPAIALVSEVSQSQKSWEFFVSSFAVLFNCVMRFIAFFDVIITFFIGELEENGLILIPTPFFRRWILPGIVLQLLVNPTLKSIASTIREVIPYIARNMDFFRVLLWAISLKRLSLYVVEKASYICKDFVRQQNSLRVSATKERLKYSTKAKTSSTNTEKS